MRPSRGYAGGLLGASAVLWLAVSSLNQSHNSAPIHPVKRMNDVVPIEHREKTFHSARCVAIARPNLFPKDSPGVLNGPHERLLVWIIHDCTQT
jgi:hypothetical protein